MLLLAIVALGVPLAINLRARVSAEVRTQARGQADLVAAEAADMLGARDSLELATLAQTAARQVRGRILIVNQAGAVLVDSTGPAEVGTSYESRPEIQSALLGHPIQVQRSSHTLGREILATAVPIIRHGRPVGAVRVTQSVAAVNSAVGTAILGLALLGAVVLALGLLAGAVIAAQVARPIRQLEAVARRVAEGELLARAPVEGSREQRSLARSFNEMTARVAALLRAQSDFVADASHQLRTPLTALRLRLEEARALDERPQSTEIDAAIGEVDRLSHTVDELLALSGAGDRQARAAEVDLHLIASSALWRWQAQSDEREIALVHAVESGAGAIWASPADVERALDALIENALRYSPSGTTVTIASGPRSLEVRDRGPGVEAEELELVFERFHRGAAGRAGPPGSGLGLAIARELAGRWGGNVSLAPRPGGGTIARLSLSQAAGARAWCDDRFANA